MTHLFLVVLCVIVVVARGCVQNGYGEEGEGGCALLYCDKGYEPDEAHERCLPCPKGRFSETQDLGSCDTCPGIPVHADPSMFGETSADCAYVCHPGTYGPDCKTPYQIAMPIVLVAMLVTALWALVSRLNAEKKTR